MLFFLCQGGAALLKDFLCFDKPGFGHFSGVVEEVNPGKFVVVRHAIGFGPLRLSSDDAFILCLSWLSWHLRRLLLFGSDLKSLITLKVCCQLSLSGGRDKIVRKKNCLVTRLFLITNLGRLLEAFLFFCAFFNPDHRLFMFDSGADHDHLVSLLRLRLGRRFGWASLTGLTHFFIRDQRVIIHVHRLLITQRSFTMLYLFEVVAVVVGQSQGFFITGLHFGGVIT